jgi:hypothetical protein
MGGSAGSTGSVYAASLTVTPLVSGDSKGTVAWSGPGSPAEWTPGGVGVTFLAGTPLWLDSAGSHTPHAAAPRRHPASVSARPIRIDRAIAVYGNIIVTAAGADIAVHQPALPRPLLP